MKRVLSFLMAFTLLITSFSHVAYADEATGETTGAVVANAEEGETVSVNLKVGDTATYILDGSIDVNTLNFSSDYVKVQVTPGKEITYEQHEASVARLSDGDMTEDGFVGSAIDLKDCLFTFDVQSEGTDGQNRPAYNCVISNDNGIFLNHNRTNAQGFPGANTSAIIRVEDEKNGSALFLFNQPSSNGVDSYLFFYKKSGANRRFDKNSTKCGSSDSDNPMATYFELYRESDNAPENSPIKGYEQITQLTDIQDDAKYLIVAKVEKDAGNDYYVLRPSTDSSAGHEYQHVAKIETVVVENGLQKVDLMSTNDVDDQLTTSDCLFTFTSTGKRNTYEISAQTKGENAATVYLGLEESGKMPTKTTRNEIVVSDVPSGNFMFGDVYSTGTKSAQLHFWINGDETQYFDRCESDCSTGCKTLEIYKPSLNSPTSPIKGYEKVTSSNQIKNGGRYLIVGRKTSGDNVGYYLLYPSTGTTSSAEYAVKVTDSSVTEDMKVVAANTVINITAVKETEGTTDVTVGDVTYRVTVQNEENEITLVKKKAQDDPYIIDGVLLEQSSEEDVIEINELKNVAPYTKTDVLAADEKYLIGTIGTNPILVTNESSNNGLVLKKEGVDYSNNDYTQYLWTVKANANGYTIQDSVGQYINFTGIAAQTANLNLSADNPQVMNIIRKATAGGYGISNNGRYFNDYQEAGWLKGWHGNGATWYFLRGTDKVEVSPLKAGTAYLTVSGVDYTINVVDIEELEDVIINVEERYPEEEEGDYLPPDWNAYQSALSEAKACIENPATYTQDAINTAKEKLEKTIQNLVKIEIPEVSEGGIRTAVAGYSLVLAGNIGVNFHMWIDEDVVSENEGNLYMEFTLEGNKPFKVALDKENMKNGYYIFQCPVPVKDMNTGIRAKIVVVNGENTTSEGVEFPYTVKQYINVMLGENSPYEEDTELIKLVEKMDTFGTSAATYFDEEATGEVMSPDEKAVLKGNLKTALNLGEEGNINLPEKGTYYGSSLLLKSDTILRHYFTKEVTVAEAGYNVEQKGKYWYVETEGITADQLGVAKTVTVTTVVEEGETPEIITITYSPLSYAYIALESEDAKLVNLMGALYEYQQAADAYINK